MATLKTQEQCQPILRSSVVTANFEKIQFLKFFFPTWTMYLPVGNGFAHKAGVKKLFVCHRLTNPTLDSKYFIEPLKAKGFIR